MKSGPRKSSRSVRAVGAALGAVSLVLGACAQIPLHADLTDTQLRERLDANFTPRMTRTEVDAKLDELKVSKKTRLWYEQPPAPPQLLVRVYEPGGFWLDDEDQTVEWVDAVFVFTPGEPEALLNRTETFRRRQRYFQGEPVNIPDTPTMHPWGDYPMSPPPPARPLVGE